MFFFIYNLFFPLVFLFFLPGLVIKLIRRPGEKHNYPERFGIFSKEKKAELAALKAPVWIHAVSVGETNLALTVIQEWRKKDPARAFVLSTTTTTAQEIARKRVPANVSVIFCPVDFLLFVRRAYQLIRPAGLVIMETEIWPNLLHQAKKRDLPAVLLNARMSDKSVKGYRRFRKIFAPLLRQFDAVCVQTQQDAERYLSVAPELKDRLTVCGNIKFDQRAPEHLKKPDPETLFGKKPSLIVIGASTHNGEEKLLAEAFKELLDTHPDARLILVPRHAERGGIVREQAEKAGLRVCRRSLGETGTPETECLLADTTGELQGFIAVSDIVVMGKTFAGNCEGQNIIEPAVLGKPILCGPELRNFREALAILLKAGGVMRLENDAALAPALRLLAEDPARRAELGRKAFDAIAANSGAVRNNMQHLEKFF